MLHPCVYIERLVMGILENNVYIIAASEDAQRVLVVDPTCEPERILRAIGERTCEAIVLTHAHWDHAGAAHALREATGAQVIASAADAPVIEGREDRGPNSRRFERVAVDLPLGDGDEFEAAGIAWRAILTPGHTPGSMCLFTEPAQSADEAVEAHEASEAMPVLISGDTLFCGTIGRTDFEGGSLADMCASLGKLAELPNNTLVLPGHNDLTTIGAERQRVFARYRTI